MKTIQDLVDTLNKKFDNEFDLLEKENGFEFCLRVDGAPIIDFNSRDKSFEFQSYIEYVYGRSLNMIVNFLANSNPSDWVPPEKKYNIIIGKDSHSPIYAAYKKPTDNEYIVSSHVFKDELINDDELQFTEQDIKKLKECLPDYLNKIIDLGKVEVKDLWRH